MVFDPSSRPFHAVAATPRASLLRASVAQRVAGVAPLVALIWLGVWWALQ
jgi:hypothetical protein